MKCCHKMVQHILYYLRKKLQGGVLNSWGLTQSGLQMRRRRRREGSYCREKKAESRGLQTAQFSPAVLRKSSPVLGSPSQKPGSSLSTLHVNNNVGKWSKCKLTTLTVAHVVLWGHVSDYDVDKTYFWGKILTRVGFKTQKFETWSVQKMGRIDAGKYLFANTVYFSFHRRPCDF